MWVVFEGDLEHLVNRKLATSGEKQAVDQLPDSGHGTGGRRDEDFRRRVGDKVHEGVDGDT